MPALGSLCFFNNKGGVGKTTLACNVASYIAETEKLNILLIDGDPQCNATQLVLPDETTERLYDSPSGLAARRRSASMSAARRSRRIQGQRRAIAPPRCDRASAGGPRSSPGGVTFGTALSVCPA
jgi:AAA domain